MARRETTEKISALYRRLEHSLTTARHARDSVSSLMQRAMLAGKVKAYTEALCLIHDKYPEHLEPGLWKGSLKNQADGP